MSYTVKRGAAEAEIASRPLPALGGLTLLALLSVAAAAVV